MDCGGEAQRDSGGNQGTLQKGKAPVTGLADAKRYSDTYMLDGNV
jgi:hypothetical protein